MEKLRNLVIAMAGNLVFLSSAKSNKDKFLLMYDYYMEWLWDRRNKMYHNKMPSEFPTLMWPEGYQKVLLEFGWTHQPPQMSAVNATNSTRKSKS